MAIELKQQIKLSQQLVMTPQLQQAIKLLQLSRLELIDTIRQELEENPVLDDVQNEADSDDPIPELLVEPEMSVAEEIPPEKEVTIEEKILSDDTDWGSYTDEYNSSGKAGFETEGKDTPKFETFISHKESLSEHLLWQFMMTGPGEEEQKIGTLIIGNVDIDGYVALSVGEIAALNGSSPEKIAEVLAVLQNLDPPGVCARDIRECLLIQAQYLKIANPLVTEIIRNYLPYLESKNYSFICKELKADTEDVNMAVNIIRGLDPRPGRAFSDEEPHYIEPDISVYKVEDDFVIMMNDDGIPRLRLNPFYRNAVNENGKFSESTKDYMQEKLRSAAWLIKSIHHRQKTIYKVMESILKFQREFFEKGVAYLKPMVLRDVAADIGMHESTISRVTTNKYAYTPQGIFELKYFFNSSINRVHGDATSSASVQEKIKHIVEAEDPKKPYSDDKVAELLENMNIHIARRTVAKYREMLRILPSNKRRQL